jgi:hypothetical protein
MDATHIVHRMAHVYRRFCEGLPRGKETAVAALHAKRPRLFQTMVQAAAADMDLADRKMAVASQLKAVDKAEFALDIAIARAREIYADDTDTAADPSVIAAAERLVEATDSLDALQRERDISQVAQLLWMREAKLMLRELSNK